MAVPDFQTFMLPLLRLAADGQPHSLASARDALAAEFKLSDADRNELLPSGRQTRFSNRVAWARSYLQQAALLVSPRRGHFQLTDRGREVLKKPPARIDIKFLDQYPEFVEFRTPRSEAEESPAALPSSHEETETPEETLEAAHVRMKAGLAAELLARVKAASPEFFSSSLSWSFFLRWATGGLGRMLGKRLVGQAMRELTV